MIEEISNSPFRLSPSRDHGRIPQQYSRYRYNESPIQRIRSRSRSSSNSSSNTIRRMNIGSSLEKREEEDVGIVEPTVQPNDLVGDIKPFRQCMFVNRFIISFQIYIYCF